MKTEYPEPGWVRVTLSLLVWAALIMLVFWLAMR